MKLYLHLSDEAESGFRRVLHGESADWFLEKTRAPQLICTAELARHLEVGMPAMMRACEQGVLSVREHDSTAKVLSTEITPEALLAIKSPAARPSSLPTGELIYFVGQEGRYVKIGYSNNFYKRFENLQCATPYRLRLLAHTPGNRKLEKSYHRQFAAHRKIGEWFRLHADIKAEIHRLRSLQPSSPHAPSS